MLETQPSHWWEVWRSDEGLDWRPEVLEVTLVLPPCLCTQPQHPPSGSEPSPAVARRQPSTRGQLSTIVRRDGLAAAGQSTCGKSLVKNDFSSVAPPGPTFPTSCSPRRHATSREECLIVTSG